MPLRTKRVYDTPSPEDGHRLLVMRRWPRGIRKEAVDSWQKGLAPSEELRQAYLRGGLSWEAFATAYVQEVTPRSDLLQEVARMARSQTITLLCGCQKEDRCHRILLKGLLETTNV